MSDTNIIDISKRRPPVDHHDGDEDEDATLQEIAHLVAMPAGWFAVYLSDKAKTNPPVVKVPICALAVLDIFERDGEDEEVWIGQDIDHLITRSNGVIVPARDLAGFVGIAGPGQDVREIYDNYLATRETGGLA